MEQPDFESILEAYPVRVANFEGPLDLLLHLIKQNELNIYDIPIALITKQYLDYLAMGFDEDAPDGFAELVAGVVLRHPDRSAELESVISVDLPLLLRGFGSTPSGSA